jgi:dihydrofolate reductase
MTTLSLIWAQGRNRVIGAHGAIPWHLPEDLKHFKELTYGKPVIMGRRTWESLPARQRPLPGRRNIVISSRTDFKPEGAEVYPDLKTAVQQLDEPEAFVIGGARLYEAAMTFATHLYITEVDLSPEGDTFVPKVDATWWMEAPPTDFTWLTSSTGLRYRYVNYRATFPQVLA